MKTKILFLVGLVILLTSCSPSADGSIRIEDAWARPASAQPSMKMTTPSENNHHHSQMSENPNSMAGSTSAIYLVIYNDSQKDDRLIAARSSVAEMVEIHETRMENDIMRMQQVNAIDLPAKSKLELKPGGYHIMLINLKQDLSPGDKVPFTLVFEKQGEISLEAEVRMP